MLKIEDGCDNFCSYCIVPHARGGPRGVPLADVVARAEALVAAGAREIVLTGINLGRYTDAGARRTATPTDAESGGACDLAAVVAAVAGTSIARLRLSSIEPPDLTPRLLGVLAATPAVCPHLHVPLQSGSDAVLRAMHRTYTAERYAEWIAAARDALPGLAVTTDIIAGFPGETEQQAAETLAFVERVGFAKLHVFRYSERPGTPAAALPGAVPPEVRAERASALRQAGDRMRAAYIASRQGCEVEVLVESVDNARAVGTTTDYLRVRLCAAHSAVGDLVTVRLGSEGSEVLG
jgi:threonylcarbamoyladenosine tRNA methylthiotransferase MtaB